MLTVSSAFSLIEDIYEAGTDPAKWLATMKKISDAVNAEDAVLGGMTAGGIPLFIAPRTDPAMVRLYAEHYHAGNPMPLALQKQLHGRAIVDADLVDLAVFHRTAFYNEWCVPQRHSFGGGMKIRTTGGWQAILMISARQEIEPDALRILELLAPHLTRALQINQILEENHARTLSVFSALEQTDRGVFLVSADQTCEPVNALAEAMVTRGSGLAMRGGQLVCWNSAETRTLQRLLGQCADGQLRGTGASLAVSRPNAPLPLQLLIIPLPEGNFSPNGGRHRLMVVVSDPDLAIARRIEQLQRDYRLTLSETEVLRELASGGDREQIASRLGISLATVRTQLTSIFDKSGLRRQTDVLRLLMAPH